MSSRLSHLECARCGTRHDVGVVQTRCGCGGTLLVRYDLEGLDRSRFAGRSPGMWRYRELLPVMGEPVSLGEPATPLLACPRLSDRFGVEVLVKDEGPLPGGTFKARGAAVGLSRAVELGVKALVMPSAGNAGGAWSLYAARAGLPITVVMARTAPVANQEEVKVTGAILELVEGTIADAGRRAKEIAAETGAFFAATFSEPYRLEGKKTAWLEVFETLGWRSPATVITPVGGGVAAVACSKVVEELNALGGLDGGPRIVGVQPQDCSPIVRAYQAGADSAEPWPTEPTTVAAGLRVPAPSESGLVLDAVRGSEGSMVAVTEGEIREAVRALASLEGIFACPEGAATVAAAERLAVSGELSGPVVLYNTGSGTKYMDVLVRR